MVAGVKHDVARARQPDQLRQRERRVRGPAPRGDHHLANRGAAEHLQRAVGNVGAGQVVRIGREHSGHIKGDVAVADDHDAFVAEIDWQVGKVGMPVDPCDQLGGGSGARQTHPVDVQPAIVGRTDRVQHGVMMGQQVGVTQVLADLHVEVEPEVTITATRSNSRVTLLVFW